MANKDNRLVGQLEEQQPKRKAGFFRRLFTWLVLPIMLVVAILLIVATLMDTNVFDLGKKAVSSLPFVPSEEQQAKEAITNNDKKVVSLQASIQEKEAEIAQLQKQLDTIKAENEQNAIEKEQLQFEIEKLNREQDAIKSDFNDILTTYDKMSPKAIGPVVTKMSDAEALRILTNLKPDKLAAVLEKMDPQDAAKYTEMMTKQ
ncbi:magnesium transporter MgtE N-terminal domain-containing protein [Lysinibacillus piscis]|uniref:Magnesium transporter MgtE intracellular domain-containing protein n=1 Tax=Lysinibacillus piscis TaxID=2518931 RepID=A0ABQ5NG99_9BACI|nr:hypothetical protein [Lysinibacillus sp. KH24]GLC87399.1 hypothetical protein LYSBPC_05260 [Lysinibacillus sp. KH24]